MKVSGYTQTQAERVALRQVAKRNRRLGHVAVWLLGLVPAGLLIFDGFTMRLGVNPIETITDRTGWWALFMLAATLTVTPLRRLFGWHGLVRFRRQLGLTSFIYASLHLATYAFLDLGLDFGHLAEDVLERPFITIGVLAWVLLLVLALTSTTAAIRRLGKRWKRLHQAVYLVAGLVMLHFFWSQKSDGVEQYVFLAVFVMLMAVRVIYRSPGRRVGSAASKDAP